MHTFSGVKATNKTFLLPGKHLLALLLLSAEFQESYRAIKATKLVLQSTIQGNPRCQICAQKTKENRKDCSSCQRL